MRNSAKGVLAAGAAVALLVGGGGTLAFWTETQPISGGALNTGHLNIVTDGINTGCGVWQLDSGESVALTYADGDPLVPGDVLTRECNYTIEAVGNHLRATVGISAPNFSGVDGDFGGFLTANLTDIQVNSSAATEFTEANDGQTLTAVVTVSFDELAGNATEDLGTVLDELTLTATQVHS